METAIIAIVCTISGVIAGFLLCAWGMRSLASETRRVQMQTDLVEKRVNSHDQDIAGAYTLIQQIEQRTETSAIDDMKNAFQDMARKAGVEAPHPKGERTIHPPLGTPL